MQFCCIRCYVVMNDYKCLIHWFHVLLCFLFIEHSFYLLNIFYCNRISGIWQIILFYFYTAAGLYSIYIIFMDVVAKKIIYLWSQAYAYKNNTYFHLHKNPWTQLMFRFCEKKSKAANRLRVREDVATNIFPFDVNILNLYIFL